MYVLILEFVMVVTKIFVYICPYCTYSLSVARFHKQISRSYKEAPASDRNPPAFSRSF